MTYPVDLVEDVVRRARRAGAEEAEAYFEERQTTRVELRDQAVEAVISAATRGLGLRVLLGGACGYAYTPDLKPVALDHLAQRAVALARVAAPELDRHLPALSPGGARGDLKIFDPALSEVALEQKIELLRLAERTARDDDRRVSGTETARYTDSYGSVALANSSGFAASYQRSSAWISLVVIASQDGEALRGYGLSAGRGFGELSAWTAGHEAARRAVLPLGGRPVRTGRFPVIMDPVAAAEFLGQVVQALSGEAVLKGRSMFADLPGDLVASPLVSLVDQGDLVSGLASSPFDGEGVPTRSTTLIDQGRLRGLLHNTITAQRRGAASTGNGVRQSYRAAPEVGPTNLRLVGPTTPREALLASVGRGLRVVTTRNVGGINPVSADYSVGAAGVWIEDGQEAGPVAGVTIAANMRHMLANIAAVGDDFRWTPGAGAIGCGSLRVDDMMVAGV